MRVLVLISDRYDPPVTAPRVRNAGLWPAARRLGAEVRILGCAQRREEAGPTAGGEEYFALDRDPLPVRAAEAFVHTYHQWPRSRGLRRRAAEVAAEWRPDVVHAEELRMAAYLPAGLASLHSVTLHNVESDLQRQIGSTPFGMLDPIARRLQLHNLVRFERRMLDAVDLAFAFSPVDLARWRALHPSARCTWRTTRNGTDVRGIIPPPQPEAPGILLVGSLAYAPNYHGTLWFLEQVLPRIPLEWPVTVAGSFAPPPLREALARTRVRFADTPRDLAPYYAASAICVAPVFAGSGTRTKILEALAHERVVVTTPLGAEGLDLPADGGVALATDADGFVAEIVRWGRDPAVRTVAARRGRAAIALTYDWSVVALEQLEAWRRFRAGRVAR